MASLGPLRRSDRRGRTVLLVYALSLALWASSFNLGRSVLMVWLPMDPTWAGAGAVVLCLLHRLGQPLSLDPRVLGPLYLVALAFVPGAFMSRAEGYGPSKLVALFLVVLPVVVVATLLLDTRAARLCWVAVQAGLGTAVAIAALVQQTPVTGEEAGRLTLATLDTITTARFVGAAGVVWVVTSLVRPRHLLWAGPLACVCGVVVVLVGSRGPALAGLLSIAAVVAGARCFARARGGWLAAVGLVTAVAYWFAASRGGSGGSRILESVRSGLSDDARAALREDAYDLGWTHLWGIGWGGFADFSETAGEIANAQGVAYAHNSLLEAFAEGGVLAAVAVLVVSVLAVVRLWRRSADGPEAVVLATTIYWLANAQVSSDLVGNRFMWVSIAVGLAAVLPRRGSPSVELPEATRGPDLRAPDPTSSQDDRARYVRPGHC